MGILNSMDEVDDINNIYYNNCELTFTSCLSEINAETLVLATTIRLFQIFQE